MSDVICGRCRIPVVGPLSPRPTDIYSCPQCGARDPFIEVLKVVEAYAAETMARKRALATAEQEGVTLPEPELDADLEGPPRHKWALDGI